MKIYTKTGDKGTTALFGGKRVSKADLRIEAYGTVDELNSTIGVIIDSIDNESIKSDLLQIQNWLFTYGAYLATVPGKDPGIPLPEEQTAAWMEERIDAMEEQLPALKNFILPSGYLPSSFTHVARCVCRRAERRIVALQDGELADDSILIFFNRLSDYLFSLSRYISFLKGVPDQLWSVRKK